jgi:GDPmannose 4,6-dehydratase
MKKGYDDMRILSINEAQKIAKDKPSIIVTGVSGQDGSFMADYLLKNTNYVVFGGARRLSVSNHENIHHLDNNPKFYPINFDLTDAHSIENIVTSLNPIYFINFAAQSFVKSSWDFPVQTWDTNTRGVLHILESIRLHAPACRLYNAGSSEEFGNVIYSPQDENHPLRPRSPYGASKAAARHLVKVYRESYNMYAIQGWLFNHEGTRRGEDFVTRKITKGVSRIVNEIKRELKIIPLELGNLDANRDWSDAEDCVDAVWRMLNQEAFHPKLYDVLAVDLNKKINEYVVSSGESHTIREFVEEAFKVAGYTGEWVGKGMWEKFMINLVNPTVVVKINPNNYRTAEVEYLRGDSRRIIKELGWSPKTGFKTLVRKMVLNDINKNPA